MNNYIIYKKFNGIEHYWMGSFWTEQRRNAKKYSQETAELIAFSLDAKIEEY